MSTLLELISSTAGFNTIIIVISTILLGLLYFKDSITFWLIVAWKTAPRDLYGLSCLLRFRYRLWRFKCANGTISGLFFSRSLRKWKHKTAFLFEDDVWTFEQVGLYAQAIGFYFYRHILIPLHQDKQKNSTVNGDKLNNLKSSASGTPKSKSNLNKSFKEEDHDSDVSTSTNFSTEQNPIKTSNMQTTNNQQSSTNGKNIDTQSSSQTLFAQPNGKPIIALFMESRPEFVCCWLGLSRVGLKSALINSNLRGETLANSINALPAIRILLYGIEMQSAVNEIQDFLRTNGIATYCMDYTSSARLLHSTHNPLNTSQAINDSFPKNYAADNHASIPNGSPKNTNKQSDNSVKNTSFTSFAKAKNPNLNTIHIDSELEFGQPLPPEAIYKARNRHEILFYIYTSGTTGLPKAAIVSHVKYFYLTYLVSRTLKINENDIIYTALPLYHTAGGIVGVGQALLLGSTVVVRKKFSASAFWTDCIKYGCTCAQYIGEICRYLLARPPDPAIDRGHRVRLMYGNGLRASIWGEFVERFGIAQIGEFYGATESNANMVNMDNKFGSVGFNSVILPQLLSLTLIRVDRDSGEVIRDPKTGLCISCKPGEPGELVGRIIRGDPLKTFQGYSDRAASKKKIVRDVFKHGDAAFLSGDILIQDELGYFYFVDRTGDTFRWKGENVSTQEVENNLVNILKQQINNSSNASPEESLDVIVYGVPITGLEGKAGMALIILPGNGNGLKEVTPNFCKALYDAMSKALPSYALPVFLRFSTTESNSIEYTSTFKPKKGPLVKQGYKLDEVNGDQLYILDASAKTYVPLTPEIYTQIEEGKYRL